MITEDGSRVSTSSCCTDSDILSESDACEDWEFLFCFWKIFLFIVLIFEKFKTKFEADYLIFFFKKFNCACFWIFQNTQCNSKFEFKKIKLKNTYFLSLNVENRIIYDNKKRDWLIKPFRSIIFLSTKRNVIIRISQ